MEDGRAIEGRSSSTSILHPRSSIPPSRPAPQLLVSVRSAAEARAALAGGCDILDVKEPSRGALGMADREIIQQVLAVSAGQQRIPVTAALGEAREWLDPRAPAAVPGGVSLVKLGLSELGQSQWQTRWREARERVDEAAGRKLRWIAVAYADWRSAAAPPPGAVVEAAITTRCAGVLFDTYRKDGRHLLDHFERHKPRARRERQRSDRLQRLTATIQAAGLLVALAGSLTIDLLPEILLLRPDVIAIRGAACVDRNRSSPLSAAAVATFRRTMAALRPASAPTV